MFPLLRSEVLLRKIEFFLASSQAEFRLLEKMDCVGNLQCDLLPELSFGIQVATTRDQRGAQIGLRGPVLDGQIQSKRKTIRGKPEAKHLAQGIAQAAAGG